MLKELAPLSRVRIPARRFFLWLFHNSYCPVLGKNDLGFNKTVYFSPEHYQHHWFPDRPQKGSGYRCIRINHEMDPLIGRAAGRIGLTSGQLFSLLPRELTLWVDPYEVSYRIGEDGSICVLYEAEPPVSSPAPLPYDQMANCKNRFMMSSRTSPPKNYLMMVSSWTHVTGVRWCHAWPTNLREFLRLHISGLILNLYLRWTLKHWLLRNWTNDSRDILALFCVTFVFSYNPKTGFGCFHWCSHTVSVQLRYLTTVTRMYSN